MKPFYIPKDKQKPRDFKDEFCDESDGKLVYICKHYGGEFCPDTCSYARAEELKSREWVPDYQI